ncbi:glycosyltransferase [Chlorogloeopsis sp. ULAP01]|nr:glycosyltransferase [Chlorogloeopsis sp. ULAP01]
MKLHIRYNKTIKCSEMPPPKSNEEGVHSRLVDCGQIVQSQGVKPQPHPLKIALYSHDTMGLGHKRRNLLIAQTLARSLPHSSILLISGMEEGRSVNLPANVDYLSLPALQKEVDGHYQPRRLEVSLQELIAIRSQVIQAAIGTFAPDLFVVDNVPRGAVRELNPTLEQLCTQGQTRCVLGLRDVLDEPRVVQREWRRARNEEAILKYYDAVWVYGDPDVFDPIQKYRFSPEIAAKVRYAGYFNQCHRLQYVDSTENVLEQLKLPPGKLALCLVGGGQDGALLGQMFAQATLPSDMNGVILTGPFMPSNIRQLLYNHVKMHPRLRVLEYLQEPTQLLSQADCVVSMGGYNTTCELLSFGKRSLIVPRVTPRLEQWIRAKRLQELGWIDVLHPDHLTPNAIANWLRQCQAPSSKTRTPIDLNGLNRLPELVMEVLTNSTVQSKSVVCRVS